MEAKLGANAILGVSMACTRAAAAEKVTTRLFAKLSSGRPSLRTHCRLGRIKETFCPPRPSLQRLERWIPRRRSSCLPRIHDLPR